jgi:predicted nucleic acid-binding protein
VRLFDTSVVIDCREPDSPWHDWAVSEVATAVDETGAGLNPVVLAEVGVKAKHRETLTAKLEALGFTLLPLPVTVARHASEAFALYLQRCKREGMARASQVPLPDFLIGAHAAAENMPLVTRDPDRVSTYFPQVRIICPP